MQSIMTSTVKYSDIILPARDWMWEEKQVTRSAAYGAFESINYCPQVVDPPGEVKSWVWVYIKLAEKLGIDPKRFFKYYTSDENWELDWERYQKDCYQNVIDYYNNKGEKVPSWEEFIQGDFINCDEYDEKPFTGWDAQIKEGKPFKTKTGKIEFYSDYIAEKNNKGKGEHIDPAGQIYDNLASDWGDLPPKPTYLPVVRGIDDPLTKEYPLVLLTSHSRYRVHYLFWDHDWLRNNVYKHRVWINAADAQARGIKTNDMVKVFNDRGTILMPAFITCRIMPGIVLVHAGGKFIPDESGVDTGACPSVLLGGDFESCVTPAKATNLVQVELVKGAVN